MASYRYRTKVPAEHLGARINGGPADIAVFSKPMKGDKEIAEQVKEHGGCVVVDICDPHSYDEILQYADMVVCPTKVMQEHIWVAYEREAHVVPDPWEFEEVAPHANGIELLWFGHETNLQDIYPWRTLNMRVVTGPQTIPGTTFYSPENLHRALTEANMVLLPSRPAAVYKSPNRLLNAVRMGCFPVCDEHPAYEEFREWVWASGVGHGLKWAKHYKEDLNDLVRGCQDYIRDRYSPKTVGEQWKELLDSI